MNSLKYKKVFEEVVKLTTRDETIKKYIQFIVLLGSVKYGEEVENYSDLDILFILKSNNFGAIEKKVLDRLKKINEKLSKKNNIEISLLPHTIFDFREYVDFNYLIHYSWGKVVYGDHECFNKLFKEIIKEKYTDQKRKELIYYNLIHARFNLFRKYLSWNENNKDNYSLTILKLFIDNIIEICDWALVFKNIFKKNKKDIANKFIEEYPNIKRRNIILKALEIRYLWNTKKINEDEAFLFFRESLCLVEEIIEVIYEKYKKN